MDEKQFKLGKAVDFIITKGKYYSDTKILGVTINREYEYGKSRSFTGEIHLRRLKYELNIWLFIIGFHVEVRGKYKSCEEID